MLWSLSYSPPSLENWMCVEDPFSQIRSHMYPLHECYCMCVIAVWLSYAYYFHEMHNICMRAVLCLNIICIHTSTYTIIADCTAALYVYVNNSSLSYVMDMWFVQYVCFLLFCLFTVDKPLTQIRHEAIMLQKSPIMLFEKCPLFPKLCHQ